MKRTTLTRLTLLLATVCCLASAPHVHAQETPNGVYFTGGVDLVSSYLWRGYREAGVSMQPSIALNAGGFKLSAWGSADLTGISYRELDLKATYVLGPVTFSVIDVYCVNPSQEGDHNHNYFSYNRQGAPHRVEAGVAWCISKKVPLTIAWYTTLVGGSDYDENGKRTWASYAQLSYPFSVKGIDLEAGIGIVPWAAPAIYRLDRNFYVQDVFLNAGKSWRIESLAGLTFSVFTTLSWSPAMQDANIMGGIAVKI